MTLSTSATLPPRICPLLSPFRNDFAVLGSKRIINRQSGYRAVCANSHVILAADAHGVLKMTDNVFAVRLFQITEEST